MTAPAAIIITLLLLVPHTADCSDTFYRWVDEKGVTHLTDHAPGHHAEKPRGVQEVRVHVNPPPMQANPPMGSMQTNVHPDFSAPGPGGSHPHGYGAERHHHDRQMHGTPRPSMRPPGVHSNQHNDAYAKQLQDYNERVRQYNAQVAEHNRQMARQKQIAENERRQQAYRENQLRQQPTNRDSGFKPYQSNHYTDRYQGPQIRQAPEFSNRGPTRHGR